MYKLVEVCVFLHANVNLLFVFFLSYLIGERILDQIYGVLKRNPLSAADLVNLEQLSQQFYTAIPHKLGRS